MVLLHLSLLRSMSLCSWCASNTAQGPRVLRPNPSQWKTWCPSSQGASADTPTELLSSSPPTGDSQGLNQSPCPGLTSLCSILHRGLSCGSETQPDHTSLMSTICQGQFVILIMTLKTNFFFLWTILWTHH
uniref:Secreted protein n=1 Tax=Molossus molossus TaxID=27622 RepID=A0A7J8C8W1_MOLMO|nr:hypothetical protein HJG59_009912 [Molossus molossus]